MSAPLLDGSTETMRQQVDDEGREWGLCGRTFRGMVKVCRLDTYAEIRGGFMAVIDDEPFPLCTVDEDCTFSDALSCRVRDGEVDPAARYKAHDELVAKEEAKAEAELDAEWWATWNSRKRGATFLPGGIVRPAPSEKWERRVAEIARGIRAKG